MVSTEEALAGFLKTGKEWERMAVANVPGAFVQKMPPYKGREAILCLELNPVNEAGQPTKRTGTKIRSVSEFEVYAGIIGNEQVRALMTEIEGVNPESVPYVASGGKSIEI